jgi:hypothetical protein
MKRITFRLLFLVLQVISAQRAIQPSQANVECQIENKKHHRWIHNTSDMTNEIGDFYDVSGKYCCRMLQNYITTELLVFRTAKITIVFLNKRK